MMDIGYAWLMRAAQRKGLNSAKIKLEFMLFPSLSWTLWWCSNKSRIDEIHTYCIRLEKYFLSQKEVVGFSVFSGEWNNSRRKRGGRSSSSCLSDSIESFLEGPWRGEASFRLHSSSKGSIRNQMETQPRCCALGKIKRSARSRSRISGKRNHSQSWPTSRHQEIALTVWLLKTEIEYFSNSLRHQFPHLRSRWRAELAKPAAATAAASSSPFHTQTYPVSGSRGRLGKVRPKCKTTRNTSQKRTNPPGIWVIPLLT